MNTHTAPHESPPPVPGALSIETLTRQNQHFRDSGGISEKNRSLGFLPAFLDTRTGAVYLSRFSDGRPAPMHLLDGLPQGLVLNRNTAGKVTAIRATVTAGFVRGGRFYTREQAARLVQD